MAFPVLGVIASTAAQMAMGRAGTAILGSGTQAAIGGLASVMQGSANVASRIARSGPRLRVFERKQRMSRSQRRMRYRLSRFSGRARPPRSAFRQPPPNRGQSSFDYQGQQFQSGIGFSTAGGTEMDPQQAQQVISQFTNRLAAAAAIVNVFTVGVGVAATAVKAMHGFASILVDSQRGVARYSGTMSAALAHLEVGRIERDMQQSRATGQSMAALTRSLDRLEKAMQPFREFTTNAFNSLAKTGADFTTAVLGNFAPLIEDAGDFGKDLRDALIDVIAGAGGNKAKGDHIKDMLDMAEFIGDKMKSKGGPNQGLQDLFDLRLQQENIKALRKPAPNIPNQPVKGNAKQDVNVRNNGRKFFLDNANRRRDGGVQ